MRVEIEWQHLTQAVVVPAAASEHDTLVCPDFIAKLRDGSVVEVDCKGGHLQTADDAEEKEGIGKLYDHLYDGKALFRMVGKTDYESVLNVIC